VGRVGRLHWLTGRRSPDENWDVYEAPDGRPLLQLKASVWSRRAASAHLMDIATELAFAAEDGSTPALGIDRIWVSPRWARGAAGLPGARRRPCEATRHVAVR